VTHTDETHALYRFYDATGALLYIGITADPGSRWRKHAQDKPWWHEVANIVVERHLTRTEVLEAERLAILAEHPRYNIVHNRGSATAPRPTPQMDRLAPPSSAPSSTSPRKPHTPPPSSTATTSTTQAPDHLGRHPRRHRHRRTRRTNPRPRHLTRAKELRTTGGGPYLLDLRSKPASSPNSTSTHASSATTHACAQPSTPQPRSAGRHHLPAGERRPRTRRSRHRPRRRLRPPRRHQVPPRYHVETIDELLAGETEDSTTGSSPASSNAKNASSSPPKKAPGSPPSSARSPSRPPPASTPSSSPT
jgi:predicted GIY-YIG superfamily endonuclease